MVILNASRGPSLVPRPEEKVPSFHGWHMHLIMVELTSKMTLCGLHAQYPSK